MIYLLHFEHSSFNIWKNLLSDLILNLNSEQDLNHRETNKSNHGDVASLAYGYNSLTIRASQFSSTTRNLVPRFKRGVRGEGLVTNIAGLLILACSSRRGQSNILMPSYFCFRSKWWSRHPFFGIFIVLTKRIWGKTREGRALPGWLSGT